MSRNKILAIFFLFSAAALLLYVHFRTAREASVADIENQLHASIPPGATRAAVEAFLDGKGIEHKYTEQSTSGPQFDRTEWARIRGSSKGLVFVRRDFQIIFRFDTAGRLIDSSVKESLTGL
jgi:hypothetical protein